MVSKTKDIYKLEVFSLMNKLSKDVDFDIIQGRFIHSVRVANLCEQIAFNNKYDTDIIDAAYLAGLYHDIAKLSSSNHSNKAVEYIENNDTLISSNNEIKDAILIHSAKYLGLSCKSEIGDILRDADIIDKLSFDSLCKCISGSKNLLDRLEKLYTKKEVLKHYDCRCDGSVKLFSRGMQRLSKFIEDLENCRIN